MCRRTIRRSPLGARLENSWRVSPSLGYVRLTSYSFGAFSLDLERFRLERAGQLVHVERQVFDVLAYLIAHRDRVVAKTELLDNVWGDRFVSESALSSRIKAARRAVDDDGARQSVIRTVFGRGYQFVAEVDERTSRRRRRRRRRPAPTADRAGDPLLPRRRRHQHRLQPRRRRPAARQGGELDDAPRLRQREPGVAALDRGHRRPTDAAALRRARLRHVGLGRRPLRLRRLGRGPRARRRQRRPRPLPAARRVPGRGRGGRLRRAPPGAGQPDGALRLLRPRAACVRAAHEEQRREAALDVELARVGWGRDDPSFRQVFTSQFLPDGTPRRLGRVQRAAAAHDLAGERRALPRGLRPASTSPPRRREVAARR